MKIIIPKPVKEIIKTINDNNFEAYVVGGCVRDCILNKNPYDWDITTNATPLEITKIFKEYNQVTTGIKHGTVGVVYHGDLYEITTYRIDGNYEDNRHPKEVTFSKTISDDLIRRDFTINSIAYNDKNGLVDISGGINDIKNKIIKCVGNPDTRFKEDALRILRALRFSATFGFEIEENTSNSILKNKELLKNISKERISAELTKILIGNYCGDILRKYHEIFFMIIPNLKIMYKYNQFSLYHNLDLWEHTVTAVENVKSDNILRMVMLLHDTGKPEVQTQSEDGICHYYGHSEKSVDIADIVLKDLKYSKKFINEVKTLILYHDYFCDPCEKSVKKLLNKISIEQAYKLAQIQLADCMAKSDYRHKEQIERIDNFVKILDKIKLNNTFITLKDLKVNGNDIINIGITQGEIIGKILKYLLEQVENETVKNNKDDLILLIDEYKKLNNL